MTIEYRETTEDLLTRIDIHKKYGGKDIDQWMLDLLNVQPGARILDVGCGAGKQCFLFHKALQGQAEITGGDLNEELLTKAREENAKIGSPITITELDFNKAFPFSDAQFDLLTCCFAIYYAADIPYTISQMHRVLKPGGRLFTSGPMPQNKQLFYDVIREATGKEIPPMPGSSRYSSQILSAMRSQFKSVEEHIFENPLTFEAVEPFLDYTRASLSEDRKLWKSFFESPEDFERIMGKIKDVSERRMKEDGQLVMVKVVGGFIAHA
ncbi:MAG TPA: methyltransferase domain-containing protein [Anaerolineales bacterium]|nr:methyltransferase domain-containing protein [Anaerolineales bacterium]